MPDRKKVFALLEALTGTLFIAWLFLPFAAGPLDPYGDPALARALLAPWAIPFFWMRQGDSLLGAVLLFLSWTGPLFGAWRIAAFFLGNRISPRLAWNSLASSAMRFLATGLMVAAFALPILAWGDRPWYYAAVPVSGWVGLALAFLGSVFSAVRFIYGLNMANPVYREYRDFKADQRSLARRAPDARRRMAMGFVEAFLRIRAKLIIAFIGVIAAILLVLITVVLGSYRESILKAVGDGARSQMDQAAGIYKVNLGDTIAMGEYMSKQVSLNRTAAFHFQSFTIFSNRRAEIFLDQKGTFPDFAAEYSSQSPLQQFPAKIPPLPGSSAAAWASLGEEPFLRDRESRTITFVSPIVQTVRSEGARRDRLLGFASVRFEEVEILEPFFRTRNSVIALTLSFLYLSVILVYLVGNYIVNPLLFLRMNVRKISTSLERMMRGETRVSAQALSYEDSVETRDEIKALSGEIGNMVTVIRGIIPYISTSTLKAAESGIASSSQKDLAFLFTDIRGFTSLCEGMAPDQVVGILNHYLDLETEIIMANHGDVDKFVGDEMMASFDGPEKEINACRAALQIIEAMARERETRMREGLPTVEIGIGINTGPVVFGSVGARDRMDFTSIGDTVNLAARLEGANKAYQSKCIITEAVRVRLGKGFICRELDFIAVKGKTEPVRIYEILEQGAKPGSKAAGLRKLFEEGLSCYRAREWKKAEACFRKAFEATGDGPSQVFLGRVEHFLKDPPPSGWDGVFRMKVK